MSIDRTYHCDAPECEVHATTATPPPYVLPGFLQVRQGGDGGSGSLLDFCCWDCLLKYAAQFPPPERIEITGD